MCRNIKLLLHFEPPATRAEIEASALQYVRKLSGMNHASKVNEEAFNRAVQKVRDATMELFDSVVIKGPPRTRDAERAKAAERGKKREAQLRARLLKTTN